MTQVSKRDLSLAFEKQMEVHHAVRLGTNASLSLDVLCYAWLTDFFFGHDRNTADEPEARMKFKKGLGALLLCVFIPSD